MTRTADATTSRHDGRDHRTSDHTGHGARARDPRRSEVDLLFAQWQQQGDRRAREQLVERFLPLAHRLARRYLGAREPVDDLVQVASLGLVKAIDRYDGERGVAFRSFAVPTILGELRRYFRDSGWAIHVPRGAQEMALQAERTRRELTGSSGREPSIAEIAEYLEWSVDEVLEALEAAAAHHATSLETPIPGADDEDWSLADTLGQEDARLETVEEKLSIAQAAGQLTARERSVLYLRFIEDLTQSQIAEQIGVSQMQVSRILRTALQRLRDLADPDPSDLRPAGGLA